MPFLSACSAFLVFNASSATTHYVSLSSTNPISPYISWTTAATNIQNAVNAAISGDLVLVTNGVYQNGTITISGVNRVAVDSKTVIIQSINGPAFTTIQGYQVPGTTNGNSAVRCVYLSSGATLSGFTLTNGATQTSGLANAGGIYCQSSSALVTNCVITGNAAYGNGGGVYSGTVINCILNGNSAGLATESNGGGAYESTLINCLLTGNQSGYRGGAAQNCALLNCTIVNNTGQTDGIDGCKLTNCLSYYNSYDNGGGSGDANFFNYCCTIPLPYDGIDIITNPPAFVNLTNGDFHLLPWSPCINAGNNSFITISNDLDGNPRIVGGTVDIGAYEFQSPVHFVNLNNSTPVSPFTNWVTAATNIQDAIDAANVGDFVVVSNGVYKTGGRIVYGNPTNRVVINKAVTVQSINGSSATRIEGSGSALTSGIFAVRCAYLTNGAVLIGFTLTNGDTPNTGDLTNAQSGGGVWCESTSAILSNCVLVANYAIEYGGAAYQGTLDNCAISNNAAFISGGGTYLANLNNCVVSSNKLIQGTGGGGSTYGVLNNCLVAGNFVAGYGGGTYFSTLNNCMVSNNSASFGGGVCYGVVSNTIISSNKATIYGGGAYLSSLNNCTVVSNSASGTGGGAYGGALNNCLLAGNSASYGGAVASDLYVPPPVLNNCTIYGNSASVQGGGLISAAYAAPSQLFVTNCIAFGNTAPTGSNYFFGYSVEITFNYCCTAPLPTNGAGNIADNPQLVNPAGGDFHLQSNSPCINAGNNSGVTNSTDLDGNPRIVGGTVDIGAYEFQAPQSIISYAWLQQYGLPTDGSADFVDSDGDSFNNWQEWHAGMSPGVPSTQLQMLSPTPTNNSSGVTISWQSVSGINYFVQRGSDLGAQPVFSTTQSGVVGQAGTTSFTDTTATNIIPYFYRVGVQ